MDLVSAAGVGAVLRGGGGLQWRVPCMTRPLVRRRPPQKLQAQPFPVCPFSSLSIRTPFLCRHRRKKGSYDQSVLEQATTISDEEEGDVEADDEDRGEAAGELLEDFEDEILLDDDDDNFEDDFMEEDADLYVGDGGAGGGISLAGTWWDKEALAMAEEVLKSFGGDLKIYAFKTSANCIINLRIEKLSTKYGSPTISDIGAFSSAYRACLEEAENAGTIPKDVSLEVSSPGVERVVRIPEDLERFKEKPMFVKYIDASVEGVSPQENEGVLKLISFDLDTCQCTWGIADVRINREKAGKGRPLSKKQRDWRLLTPFGSLCLVRIYSEC